MIRTSLGHLPRFSLGLKMERFRVRPIAGTRPRGRTHEEDIALEEDLLADPKEISEHLMLIDLGRNDVSRVAEIGSVEVTENMLLSDTLM